MWGIVRWILFRLDAELAHRITLALIRAGIWMGNWPLRIVSGSFSQTPANELPEVFGMRFLSRVGLAAGFDKNAEILAGLPALGFGFAEIGTVTPRPQPGNEIPRLFRDPKSQSVFNRMGFNNLGATLVAKRVETAKPCLPANFRVGINLGKNKDTPLDQAASDYVTAARPFEGLADYLVINVSSPNTPGLRSLQSVEALRPIVSDVSNLVSGWKKRPPLLLKLAPEISGEELASLMTSITSWKAIDGWVLTNTLAGIRDGMTGGWSGGVLTEKSRERLGEARAAVAAPILSVGGILTLDEAKRRIQEGADLIQLYTGWLYQGPCFPGRVGRELRKESK